MDLFNIGIFYLMTLVFIILVLRGFFYVLIKKQDPIKALKPKLWVWPKTKAEREQELIDNSSNS